MDIHYDGSTLVLTGEFDVRNTMKVRTAIHEHMGKHDSDLVIDLTGVPTIDLTALRVLAAASHMADQRGRRIILRNAGPAVLRLLHISHLIRAVELERIA